MNEMKETIQAEWETTVDTVVAGVECCWKNAKELLDEAKLLLDHDAFARSLALSTLALEEVGKILIVDGLALSFQDDERSQYFRKNFRLHRSKLAAIDFLPFLVSYLSLFDTRHKDKQRKAAAIAISLEDYRRRRQELASWIGAECDVQELDLWKQRGFYAGFVSGKGFQSPRKQIEPEFARAVYELAWRVVDCVSFVLHENIENYRSRILSIRTKLPKEKLRALRRSIETQLQTIMGEFVTKLSQE